MSLNRIIACIVALTTCSNSTLLAAASAYVVQPQQSAVLRDGTRISVRLIEGISSATAKEGDILAFEILEDISVDGRVLVKQGTPARGVVVSAQAKRRMGRSGSISYSVTETKALDGSTVRLRATKERAANSSVGSTAVATAGVALLVPVAAPFVLLRKGKDMAVAAGTRVDAYVEGDHSFR